MISVYNMVAFEVMLFRATGNEFQKIVNQLFTMEFEGYQTVAPDGKLGDGGNDGFLPNERRFFQVYGPSTIERSRARYKVREDFLKLKQNWGHIDHYTFVMNDHFGGVPAGVYQQLEEIQKIYEIKADCIDSSRLREWFSKLTKSDQLKIVGPPPSVQVDPENFNSEILGKLVIHLMNKAPYERPATSKKKPLAFEKKLEFNGLSPQVSDLIRGRSYQSYEIEGFFMSFQQCEEQVLAQYLKKLYKQVAEEYPDNADARYWRMCIKMCPLGHERDRGYLDAAGQIVSYYFETCDVYEKPEDGGCPA